MSQVLLEARRLLMSCISLSSRNCLTLSQRKQVLTHIHTHSNTHISDNSNEDKVNDCVFPSCLSSLTLSGRSCFRDGSVYSSGAIIHYYIINWQEMCRLSAAAHIINTTSVCIPAGKTLLLGLVIGKPSVHSYYYGTVSMPTLVVLTT